MKYFKKIIIAIILITTITLALPFHIFLLGYANKPEEHLKMIDFNIFLFYFIHFAIFFSIVKFYLKTKVTIIDILFCLFLYLISYIYLYNFT